MGFEVYLCGVNIGEASEGLFQLILHSHPLLPGSFALECKLCSVAFLTYQGRFSSSYFRKNLTKYSPSVSTGQIYTWVLISTGRDGMYLGKLRQVSRETVENRSWCYTMIMFKLRRWLCVRLRGDLGHYGLGFPFTAGEMKSFTVVQVWFSSFLSSFCC